jgi:hypothetical protein
MQSFKNLISMFKPINSALKSHFNKIYAIGIEKADNQYNSIILKATEVLNHFDGLNYLLKEEVRIDELIEDDDHPYYVQNYSNEEWLLSLFANRTYLLSTDESEELINSIYQGALRSLIIELINTYKKKIPEYNYDKFISGEVCPYFSSFKNYYNLQSVDYYKIREWQSLNMVNIISYEKIILIRNIQYHCKKLENPIAFINKENELIESIFNNTESTTNDIISIFKQLYIFKDCELSKFTEANLRYSFDEFNKQSELTWFKITPLNIQPILDLLETKPQKLFSNEFTIFYTLNKLKVWYESILNGKSVFDNVEPENWDLILENTTEEAELKINNVIEEIDTFCYGSDKTHEEIKKYLRDTFEAYRYKFNEIEYKEIFHTLIEENKYLQKTMFIANSFFGNDIDKQVKNIIDASVIHDVLWHTVVTYDDIFHTGRMIFKNENQSNYEIFFILNNMIPDKEVYNELSQSTKDFIIHFHNFSLPMDVHFQNQREKLRICFDSAMNRLQEILDDAEPTNKILYLQSRIKELKQRELQLKMHEEEYYGKDDDYESNHTYSTLFKEFLTIEADYVKETSIIPNNIAFLSYPIKALETSKVESFKTVINTDNQTYILTMLEDLSITKDGVSILSERKKSALRGIVEALKEKCLVPEIGIDKLCKIIGDKIQLEINSKLDFSTTSQDFKKKALQYMKNNPID